MTDKGNSYATDARFSGYYLEDSYVLAISERDRNLAFELEAVLTPSHPEYRPPPPTEQHCYRNAHLVFQDVRDIRWQRKCGNSFVDAQGERDLGNIDSFLIFPDGRYQLAGDWGEVELLAGKACMSLD
jgi:hypothetical protein